MLSLEWAPTVGRRSSVVVVAHRRGHPRAVTLESTSDVVAVSLRAHCWLTAGSLRATWGAFRTCFSLPYRETGERE